MTKYVFENKQWHTVTRLSILLGIAPYMFFSGQRNKDGFLQILAVLVFLFDARTFIGSELSAQIYQQGRLAGLLIQAPYMIYSGYKHKDDILLFLGLLVFAADSYTFYLGQQPRFGLQKRV